MQEREDKAPWSHFRELQAKWRCELRSCSNYGLTCLVVRKRHLKLNSNDLKIWNNAIITTPGVTVDVSSRFASSCSHNNQKEKT